MLRRLVVLAALAVVGVAVRAAAPDIRRYLKLREM
jgi:hypothetical protein